MRPLPRLLFILAVTAASPAAAGDSDLFLTWHAPHGLPRATDTLSVACGDTTAADTLYLSFLPGRPSPTFLGFSAVLTFRPLGADTLGPFWRSACGTSLPRGMSAAFDPGLGYPQPWRVSGAGGTFYECVGEGTRLRMIHAVRSDQASGIRADSVLTLARLVIRHPPAGLRRCDEPVCIEWTAADIAFERGLGGNEKLRRGGKTRSVSWNVPAGRACVPRGQEGVQTPKPWSPRTGKP